MQFSTVRPFVLAALCCCFFSKAKAQTTGCLTFDQLMLKDNSGHKVRILPPLGGWPASGTFDWRIAYPPIGITTGFVQAGDVTNNSLQWDDANKFWKAVPASNGGNNSLSGGTTNTLPKWSSSSSLTNSSITDNGTNVTIGGSLQLNGGLRVGVTTVNNDYTATSSDYLILCNVTQSRLNVTLPPAANKGQVIVVSKISGASNDRVQVGTQGSDVTIPSTGALLNFSGNSATYVADGTSSWVMVANN